MIQTCQWRDEHHPQVSLSFFFDAGVALEGELLQASGSLKNSDKLISELTTYYDKKVLPLQPADLLALELWADIRRAKTKARRNRRYALDRLESHPHE